MKELTKIKEEYTAEDKKFPLNGEYARLLIENSGLTYDQVAEPANVTGNAISNWINNRSLAPRNKVLKAFKRFGINDKNLYLLVMDHPSKEIREYLQKRLDQARESYQRTQVNKKVDQSDNQQSDFDLKSLTDQVVNLTQAVNQMGQNQQLFFGNWKQLFEMLSKYSDNTAKQNIYLAQELKQLKKEIQQKNELIRHFQGQKAY